MTISGPVRVRFAPSPTGYLHVGGARTALFNWLIAKRYGGQFLLRIEDTDKARSTEASTKAIFEGLNWLGLKWDEDVVYQGSRGDRHRWIAQKLVEWNYAYPCFCSKHTLDADRKATEDRKEAYVYPGTCLGLADARERMKTEPHTIRLHIPLPGNVAWDDLIHGTINFPHKDLGGDFVILREDGSPIYNLAVVCDDIDMGITHVFRGDDHISNTPKQILLYHAIGHVLHDLEKKTSVLPEFGHMPMIFGSDGKKLSKRHGATAVGDYQNFGILPEVMLNFLALLGWSPGDDREILSVDEIVQAFSVEKMSAKAAVFDMKKLEWLNGQYMQKMSNHELGIYLSDKLGDRYGRDWFTKLAGVLKPRARTLTQFTDMAKPFTAGYVEYDEKAVAKQWPLTNNQRVIDQLNNFYDHLEESEGAWSSDNLTKIVNAAAGDDKHAFQTLRLALMGKLESPPLGEVMDLLGAATFSRILNAMEFLKERGHGAQANL